jgi:aminodeoxyfutalosine synthase
VTTFAEVQDKITRGERLGAADGVVLFNHPNLHDLAQLAHQARLARHGRTTYYNWNLHLNSTNVCEASCLFCSFARLKTGMPQAYTMDVTAARSWIQQRYKPGMTEIHIVNGLNPDLDFQYYLDLLRMIRAEFPELHIKAFTAVEIHYFAQKYQMSYEAVLQALVEAGLGSLPGGGAEIFAERVRRKICRDKASAEEWLAVHRAAHHLGLKSNCTMLYGTIETIEERVNHMLRLRDLQDETGGFQVFIPLAFHNEGNRMKNLPAPTAVDDLRVIAVSRLMLDSILHIKAYWVMLGIKTAQTALLYGASDIDGTVTEEKIYHMAGSDSPNALTLSDIRHLIESAGMVPQERTTTYSEVHRTGHEAETSPHSDGGSTSA